MEKHLSHFSFKLFLNLSSFFFIITSFYNRVKIQEYLDKCIVTILQFILT